MILKYLPEPEIADQVVASLEAYCKDHSQKRYNLMISGGNSPVRVFQKLLRADLPWEKIHIYWTDERCLPEDDLGRNIFVPFRQFILPLMRQGRIKIEHIHPLIFDREREDLGASLNDDTLRDLQSLDMLITGVGEDGHVASLFPNHDAIDINIDAVIPVFDSPKAPPQRITFSRSIFQRACSVYLLFIGEEKVDALKNFLNPKIPLHQCPVKLFQGLKSLFVYSDQKEIE